MFASQAGRLWQGQVSNEIVGNTNDTDFDDEIIDDPLALKTWDPFGGIAALEGFSYSGKLVFIHYGPTLKLFAETLALGGQSNHSVEEKKEGSRKAQRKINM